MEDEFGITGARGKEEEFVFRDLALLKIQADRRQTEVLRDRGPIIDRRAPADPGGIREFDR